LTEADDNQTLGWSIVFTLREPSFAWDGASAVTADVEELLRQQRFGSLLRLSPQAIVILDADGVIREWNPAAVDLLGWTREDLVGQPLTTVLGDHDRISFLQVWNDLKAERRASPFLCDRLHHDRTHVPVQMLLASIQDSDGSLAGVVGTLSRCDPGAKRNLAPVPAMITAVGSAGTASVWEVDETTGLPGRRWLQRKILSKVSDGFQRAVAVLDLDAFALVNQVYGPERGDQVLAELARRFTERCAPAIIGRWQADEFLFILDAVDADEELLRLLAVAAVAARAPLDLGDHQIRLTFSAGLATTTTVPAPGLFGSATAAMAHAKAHGRDRSLRFDERTMSASPGPSLRMANDLERGLAEGEMRLHFQPVVDLSTNDVVGVEALVRWERPGVGLLAPAAFLELAERTGQIVTLGEWVIRCACEAAVTFAATWLAPLRVSINLSARQLNEPGLRSMLHSALEVTGCDPTSIVVEVTETALLQDLAAAAGVLEEIRELGVEVDLDDFGTGYSSLRYLKHLPVDRIKIDQEFVSGLGIDIADTAIVASTIALAHSMGMSAVAEGVETPEQLGLLRQLGCDFAQGYLLSPPLPQGELMHWLSQQAPARLLRRSKEDGEGRRGTGDRQDLRDHVADGRDAAGDRRDLAGDDRDRAADERDSESDLRDRERDRRDAVADRREEIADEREAAARREGAPGITDATRLGTSDPLAGSWRTDASSNRLRAADDRARAAVQRGDARAERDLAEARRGSPVSQGAEGPGAGRDREPDPLSDHEEGRSATFDALTGGYLWSTGRSALEAEIDVARREGDTISVVHLCLVEGDGAEKVGRQLAQDAALVFVANILGGVLRPRDLLVRKATTELVCLLRGISASELDTWLAALGSALVAVPQLSCQVMVGSAVLQLGESGDAVLARAVTAGLERGSS
jgi:diguanylate cyclase (GGDEF)-like protein/PAS domain S-box-containing protein